MRRRNQWCMTRLMEKTDRLTKIVSLMLFLALVIYAGAYLVDSAVNSTRTSPAIATTVIESAASYGIIVRKEQVVDSAEQHISYLIGDGERVSAGEAVAMCYADETSLKAAGRMRELQIEISRLETLLSGITAGDDLVAHDTAVREAVLDLSAAIARHDMSGLDELEASLSTLVISDGATVTQPELYALKQELSNIAASSSGGKSSVLADSAGIFTSVVDGYEKLGTDALTDLTPTALDALIDGKSEASSTAIGKLVLSQRWYYAAEMYVEDAALLSVGDKIEADFGKYYNKVLTLRVDSVGEAEGDSCVVVFSCKEALSTTLAVRLVSAEIKFAEYPGIRVPTEALHFQAAGENGEEEYYYVFVVTALLAEKKIVTPIYESDDFCLVKIESTADCLRAGNEIIVSGNDIYDGKVLG